MPREGRRILANDHQQGYDEAGIPLTLLLSSTIFPVICSKAFQHNQLTCADNLTLSACNRLNRVTPKILC